MYHATKLIQFIVAAQLLNFGLFGVRNRLDSCMIVTAVGWQRHFSHTHAKLGKCPIFIPTVLDTVTLAFIMESLTRIQKKNSAFY